MPGSHFCEHHDPALTPEQRRRAISPKWANVAEANESGALRAFREAQRR